MNKLAVVTGASSGIGLEFAKLLATDKYDLIIASRDAKVLDAVADELRTKHDIKVEVVIVDLSIELSADMLWDKVGKRKVDVLINNAGFGDLANVIDADFSMLSSMIGLNITSLTRLSQLAAKAMVLQGSGNILNLASILSFTPSPHDAVYGATKTYVLNFSEALSEELRGTGVHVTILCPGPTNTGFAKAAKMENSSVMRGNLPTAYDVAMCGYRAMQKNKVVVVHGRHTWLYAYVMPKLFPRSIVRKIIGKIQAKTS